MMQMQRVGMMSQQEPPMNMRDARERTGVPPQPWPAAAQSPVPQQPPWPAVGASAQPQVQPSQFRRGPAGLPSSFLPPSSTAWSSMAAPSPSQQALPGQRPSQPLQMGPGSPVGPQQALPPGMQPPTYMQNPSRPLQVGPTLPPNTLQPAQATPGNWPAGFVAPSGQQGAAPFAGSHGASGVSGSQMAFGQSASGWTPSSQPPRFPSAPAFSNPPKPPTRRKRLSTGKLALLVVLLVLIVAGVLFGPGVVQSIQEAASIPPLGQTGAFVQPPFSPRQVNDIQHIASHMKYRQLASLYLAHMSLDEELGQLLMVQYTSDYYSDDLDTMLNQQHVGGIILYQARPGYPGQDQLRTAEQAKQDITHMQQRATTPLLIGIDEEGTNVSRLWAIYPGKEPPSAHDIGKSGSTDYAAQAGHLVAKDMQALGINVNFAPDVDAAKDDVSYIGYDYRAFGQTPDEVIKYSSPYLQAMQGDGVIGALKHFPGLGKVMLGDDPHGNLPVVNETKDQLENSDLLPFKHYIKSTIPQEQPGFIMPTDVLVPSVDPTYPAEFSHTFMTDILRNELGYDGAVISDSVIMGGVKVNGQQLTQAQAALLAIQAGDDMVLDVSGSDQVADTISTFKDALQKGTLTKARVDEAASRIIALKMQYHLMPATAV